MTHPPYPRDKARQMRVDRRMTIDAIAERLSLSRTTIYHWVRDIQVEIPRQHRTRGQIAGSQAMQAKHRLARDHAYEAGRTSFATLAADPSFRDFVCLYLAEGSKRDRNRVQVCNSDPTVVKICDRWIRRFAARPATYCVQYHADQDLAHLKWFWALELGVEPEDIGLLRKSNSNQLAKRTWRSRYGVLSITVNDTLLRARIDGWMDRLRESWN